MSKALLKIIGWLAAVVVIIFLGKHPQVFSAIFMFFVNLMFGFIDFVRSHV